MTSYAGTIDSYFVNLLSGNRRLMVLKGSFGRAFLWFDDANSSMNSKTSGQDSFTIHFPVSYWQPLVDVLRNESPVHFMFSDFDLGAQIFTGDEPVGEEEAN